MTTTVQTKKFAKKKQYHTLRLIIKELPLRTANLEENISEEIKSFLSSDVFGKINVPVLVYRSILNPDSERPLKGFANIGNVVSYSKETNSCKIEIFEKYANFIDSNDFAVFMNTEINRVNNWKITRFHVVPAVNKETVEESE